ncbi:MAG: hypothetical protein FWG64_13035 [Firmicutes bacterium]|nr:hypothetical protein [Bacillota bacterium]
MNELKTLAEPISNYIIKKHNTHAMVIITAENVQVVQTVQSTPTKQLNDSEIDILTDKVLDKITEKITACLAPCDTLQ